MQTIKLELLSRIIIMIYSNDGTSKTHFLKGLVGVYLVVRQVALIILIDFKIKKHIK